MTRLVYNQVCRKIGLHQFICHYQSGRILYGRERIFFTAPAILEKRYPAVHRQLTLFYLQPVLRLSSLLVYGNVQKDSRQLPIVNQ